MPDEPTNLSTPAAAAPVSGGLIGETAPEPAKSESLLGETGANTAANANTAASEKPATEPAATPEPVYEFKDAPEGYDVKALEAFAKEHKLAPEVAQKVLERESSVQKSLVDKLQANFQEMATTKWVEELKSDPVIGGKNWDASVAQARRANDLLSPETRKSISEAKLSNNPILFRALLDIGAKLKEDSFVRANHSGEQANNDFGVFYR
jgi:hypothetical protein